MKPLLAAAGLLVLLQTPALAQSDMLYGEPITTELARKAVTAAIAEARKNSWQIAVAIVDTAGELVFFERIDGTQTGSISLAVDKAKTAVAYKRSTKNLEDRIVEGRVQYLKQPVAIPIEGGLPIVIGGRIVGGLGVSGVRSHQDGVVAKAGIDALAAR